MPAGDRRMAAPTTSPRGHSRVPPHNLAGRGVAARRHAPVQGRHRQPPSSCARGRRLLQAGPRPRLRRHHLPLRAGRAGRPGHGGRGARRAGLLEAIGGPALLLVSLQAGTPGHLQRRPLRPDRRGARPAAPAHRRGRRDRRDRPTACPTTSPRPSTEAEALVFEVAQRRVDRHHRARSATCSTPASTASRSSTSGATPSPALPTGYLDLDELLSGLQPSTLIVVGARPVHGQDRVRPGHGRPRRPRGAQARCCSSRWR